MFKTSVIFLLLLALTGVAFLSRPSKADFEVLVRQTLKDQSSSLLDKLTVDMKVDYFMSTVEYRDNYLWSAIEKDGKTLYVGVFSKWMYNPEDLRQKGVEYVEAKMKGVGIKS